MNLSDPFTLGPLCPHSSIELPSQSSPSSRTLGSRTPNSKRTTDGSPSPGQAAKKSRRRTAERPPLVQHNAEKKQKESANVSTILQQHNKSTVCVCWNKERSTRCLRHSPSSPVEFLFFCTLSIVLLFFCFSISMFLQLRITYLNLEMNTTNDADVNAMNFIGEHWKIGQYVVLKYILYFYTLYCMKYSVRFTTALLPSSLSI